METLIWNRIRLTESVILNFENMISDSLLTIQNTLEWGSFIDLSFVKIETLLPYRVRYIESHVFNLKNLALDLLPAIQKILSLVIWVIKMA